MSLRSVGECRRAVRLERGAVVFERCGRWEQAASRPTESEIGAFVASGSRRSKISLCLNGSLVVPLFGARAVGGLIYAFPAILLLTSMNFLLSWCISVCKLLTVVLTYAVHGQWALLQSPTSLVLERSVACTVKLLDPTSRATGEAGSLKQALVEPELT